MLSPHPADPTLTTDNLMEVVKEVEHRWKELGDKLYMPDSKLENIEGLYQTPHLRMEAVVDHYVKCDPTSSWKEVGTALQEMELHQLANNITTNYVRGMDVNHVTIINLLMVSRLTLSNFTTNKSLSIKFITRVAW